ncbi:MAG: cytochrome c biogenesis protein CcdA [Propionibacteriaceae bacterium]|nr:cytochrome c biogenesis protein CcdA [Propionibacteriaceae bacterium]
MEALSPSLIRDMVAVLWAGVVSFISPCFLPVVPVFVAYLTGETVTQAQGVRAAARPNRRWFAAMQAIAFMVAFAAVFIALWSLVGLVGWVVGGFRSWLRIAGGVVLVVMGLHMAGLIHIGFLDRVLRVNYTPDVKQAPTLRRSLALGLAFGAGWTPCIGAILAAVLGLATTRDSMGQGIVLMAVYSVGLGVPFVLVCVGVSSLLARLAWFTKHQRIVNIVIGAFMIIVGFLMIADLFKWLAVFVPGS